MSRPPGELDTGAVATEALERLARDLCEAFGRAVDAGGEVRRWVRLADRRVEVRVASEALSERLLPAWEPFQEPVGAGSPDLTVRAWTSEPGGIPAPRAPLDLRDRWWRGVLADTPDFTVQLQGPIRILSVLDRREAEGHWWMPDLADVPGWETAAPFRALLHWWAPSSGLYLTHAAAVGLDGQGVLLAGKGGAGKSTTALSCLAAGMEFAGDDYVFTSFGEDGVEAHAVYATAKIEPSRLRDWFPEHASAELTEPGGKVIVPIPGDALTRRLAIRALVLPVVDGSALPRLVPAPSHAGMLALAPSTLFQLPCSGAAALRHLAAVARGLPVYRLHLSADPAANAERLADLIRSGGVLRES